MPPRLKEFLQRWIITTVAVLIAEWMVPGIHSRALVGLLVATLILGALNVVLRPWLIAGSVGLMAGLNVVLGVRFAILTLPLQVLFFIFLLLAINATLLLGVAYVVPSFHVTGFWAAFWGGVVISLASVFLNSLTKTGNARISIRRGRRPPGNSGPDDGPGPGSGPVIDV